MSGLAVARVVAEHWRDAMMRDPDLRFAAHPLACVLAAMDGETDPAQLGVEEGPDADAIRAAAR